MKKKLFFSGLIIIIVLTFLFFLMTKDSRTDRYISTEKTRFETLNTEEIKGTIYYVSATGRDTDGTDINNPMSIQSANRKTFKRGDALLLKRGDIFYESLMPYVDYRGQGMFYISSYGEGTLPIISGAKIVENTNSWTRIKDNIYRIRFI